VLWTRPFLALSSSCEILRKMYYTLYVERRPVLSMSKSGDGDEHYNEILCVWGGGSMSNGALCCRCLLAEYAYPRALHSQGNHTANEFMCSLSALEVACSHLRDQPQQAEFSLPGVPRLKASRMHLWAAVPLADVCLLSAARVCRVFVGVSESDCVVRQKCDSVSESPAASHQQ